MYPRDKAKEVVAAINKVHPYEEVAFDIYPLVNLQTLALHPRGVASKENSFQKVV